LSYPGLRELRVFEVVDLARTKLTKRTVDSFHCPLGMERATLFDSEILGLHVEAFPSGRKIYRLKWKRDGKQGRETLGEHGVITLEQARKKAIALRANLLEGKAPKETRAAKAAEIRRAIALRDLIEMWLTEGPAAAPSKRQSSWDTDARKLRRHIAPLLGAKRAREVSRTDVENAQRGITRGDTARDVKTGPRGRSIVKGGEGAARSAVLSLSSCYSWAIDQGIVDENPCLSVKKSKPRKMERFLSQEEATRLFATLHELQVCGQIDGGFADMIRLLLLTGARKSEIQELQWREIDFERQLIRLSRERSKTGEKTIPLNDEALRILKDRLRRRKISNIHAFPSRRSAGPAQGLQKAWNFARTRADLSDVRLHDLRHSFASFAAADGASLYLIGKALGHSQSQTTERYAHLRDDPLRAVAAGVQNRIFSGK